MTTSKFKRFGLPAALVVGGVTAGSFLAPIGLAAAQDDGTTDADSTEQPDAETDTETDADSDGEREGRKGHRGARRTARGEAVAEALGLTSEDVRQGFVDGKSVADMAEEQGIELETVRAALIAQASEHLDQAVEDGRIDDEQAAAKLAELESRIDERLTTVPDLSDRGRGHGHRGGHEAFEAVQEALGLTGEEIRAGLAEGKTLAELGEEQGVSAEELADLLVASMNERLDQAVEDGKVDEDRAAEIREQLEEKADERVNSEFEGRRGRGHHHRHSHGGDDADGTDGGVEDTVSA